MNSALLDRAGLGGARRDRTDDLLLAKQALSQLSYGPGISARTQASIRSLHQTHMALVGLGRLELPTSRLSGVRSNHLSYRPESVSPALAIHERKRNGDGSVPQEEPKLSVSSDEPI